MAVPKTVTFLYLDESNEKATHELHIEDADGVPEDPDLEDLVGAMQGLTAASLRQYNVLDTDAVVGAPAAANGPYSANDRLRLGFKTNADTRLVFSVPAPKAELFVGDDVVINTPGSPVAQLITDIMAIVRDRSGSLATLYTGGSRIRNQ